MGMVDKSMIQAETLPLAHLSSVTVRRAFGAQFSALLPVGITWCSPSCCFGQGETSHFAKVGAKDMILVVGAWFRMRR
jgi:hypothetical protein